MPSNVPLGTLYLVLSFYFTSVMYILVVDIVTSESGIPHKRKTPEKLNVNQINITLPYLKIVFSHTKSLLTSEIFKQSSWCLFL